MTLAIGFRCHYYFSTCLLTLVTRWPVTKSTKLSCKRTGVGYSSVWIWGHCCCFVIIFFFFSFRGHIFWSWLCHCLRTWSAAGCFSFLCLSLPSSPSFSYMDCKSVKLRKFCRAGTSLSIWYYKNKLIAYLVMASFWCVALQVKSFMLLVTRCSGVLKANLTLRGGNKEALITMNCLETRSGISRLHSQMFNVKLQALKL